MPGQFLLYTQEYQTADLSDETFLGEGVVDGVIDVQHQERLTVTNFPVESGRTSLTDHAQLQPQKIRLTGFVSDVIAYGKDPSLTRITEAWDAIRGLMARAQLVVLVTDLRKYENMLVVSASAPRNQNSGRALRFSLELQEIKIAGVRGDPIGMTDEDEDENGGNGTPTDDRREEDEEGGLVGTGDVMEGDVNADNPKPTDGGILPPPVKELRFRIPVS